MGTRLFSLFASWLESSAPAHVAFLRLGVVVYGSTGIRTQALVISRRKWPRARLARLAILNAKPGQASTQDPPRATTSEAMLVSNGGRRPGPHPIARHQRRNLTQGHPAKEPFTSQAFEATASSHRVESATEGRDAHRPCSKRLGLMLDLPKSRLNRQRRPPPSAPLAGQGPVPLSKTGSRFRLCPCL